MGYAKAIALATGLVIAACTQMPAVQPRAAAQVTGAEKNKAAVEDFSFGVLADLAGTRWRGEPGEADKEQGQPADYAEWYWDLGGTVLASRHVLEDGSYGGVTYFQRSRKPGVLDYVYITSASFRTTGSVTLNEDGSWTAEEQVHGRPHILKVRSTGAIREDGVMTVVSQTLGDEGEWSPGHTFFYTQTDAPLPDLSSRGKIPE